MRAEPFDGRAEEWDAFVAEQPAATASHLYAWKRIISQVYHHECPYLSVRENGRLTGVLPLVYVRSLAFGRFLVSMPFLNGGGPLGSETAVAALTAAAQELARRRRASLVEFRCREPANLDLSVSMAKVACVLPIPGSADALWSAMPSKLRSQVRRPRNEGIEVRFGAEQLDPFYQVFARNMRDLGSPTHRRQLFESIVHEMGSQVWFGCAYHKDVPVAGGCGLQWRDSFELTWASSLREYNKFSPNMLLYWSFMERAASLGLREFDFGRCTPNTGSHKFKLQWGAHDVPLYWYQSKTRANASTPRQDAGSLSLVSRLWQRMPVSVATLVGSRLRGGIPA